jgi:mannose-6-phosphate isomerase
MIAYPLLLTPILKHRVWGGRELERLGKALPPDEVIGESWEVADLPASIGDGRNLIANGPLAGRTLREAVGQQQNLIMGDGALTDDGGFPLLIKYLDARQNLSVQVHPTPTYAASHPDAHLKSEAWVIVDAEPGAVIYKGVRPGVDPDRFAEHIRSNEVVEDLNAVPVEVGDCHYLPSGTCHALGEGLIVAEIQTPSDTTFRVYDWGRTGRELHVEEALACIDFDTPTSIEPDHGHPIETGDLRTTPMVETDYFAVERIEARRPTTMPVVTNDLPLVWMVLDGRGTIRTPGAMDVALTKGTTVVLPAQLDADASAELNADCTLLHVTLPPKTRGMIA